jgi:exodeoxyribonuclease-3
VDRRGAGAEDRACGRLERGTAGHRRLGHGRVRGQDPRDRARAGGAGYTEVTRQFTPDAYTYWDYQKLRFPKGEGMRIDFAYASPALAATVTGAQIDREERKGKGASDHAPVIVDIA